MADDSTVLTEATVAPYSSPAERAEFGRQARNRLPRSAFADWQPPASRPDSTGLLLDQGASRIAGLIPLRHTRMADSPFTFYRGSAIVMANDLGPTLNSGLWTQACGDAHLANFGIFGSSERNLVFDLNDFDETTRGPFEWDVLRLAASFVLATTANGGGKDLAIQAAAAVGASYQTEMAKAAQRGLLANWYDKFTPSEISKFAEQNTSKKTAKGSKQFVQQGVKAARARDSWSAVRKLTEAGPDGSRRFKNQPPLLVRIEGIGEQLMEHLFSQFLQTMRVEAASLLSRYRILDMAHKVVGVGSVGLRAWAILLQGPHDDDLLVMQFKEAQRSVLEDFVGPAGFDCHGQRVVVGQRLMQATGDPFLGWVTGVEADLYGRQLRDFKWSVDTSTLSFDQLVRYAVLCGTTLAKSHARSGDPIAISGYLGEGPKFPSAVAQFAHTYAALAATDYQRFIDTVETSEIDVEDFALKARQRVIDAGLTQ